MGEFETAVTDVLTDEPEGLRSVAIWQQVIAHPDYDLTVPMKDLHRQLGELCRKGLVERVNREKRYRLADN